MEVFCTKKLESADGFNFDVPETLPYVHILTPEVILQCDKNNNVFIADCPSDPSFLTNIIKLKRVIGKSFLKQTEDAEKDKLKLQDDIIWIHQAPAMIYKKTNEQVLFSKMVLGHPVSLQLSCKRPSFQIFQKPYNVYNVHLMCDVVKVADDFDWRLLSPSG